MKAIYAFKTFKEYEHYKPHDRTFYQIARLSVGITSKFYQTKLYCDRKSLEMFDYYGVKFDEVQILDEIENYEGTITAMPKVIAMMEQTEPYILVDMDCILLQKIPNVSTIQFGYPETHQIFLHSYLDDNLDNYVEYLNKYYKKPWNKYRDRFNDWFEVDPESSPNNCVVVVNSPYMVREIYKDILSKFTDEELEDVGPMFIEQFLFHLYLKNYKVDTSYIHTSYSEFNHVDYRFTTTKLLHFLDFDTDSTAEKIKYLSEIYDIDVESGNLPEVKEPEEESAEEPTEEVEESEPNNLVKDSVGEIMDMLDQLDDNKEEENE